MRPAQKSNRSRGRGNRKGGGGGNNLNRVYDSAGPEGKVRGTPQQIIDKYLSLARDAQTSGDRVTAENFLQHAEHYQRIMIQATAAQEQARREAQEAATDSQDNGDGRGRQQQPQAAQPAAASQPQEQPQPQPQPEAADIGGMAMIDAGNGSAEEPLIGEEGSAQPAKRPRNGDGRRRRAKPSAETAPSGEQPEQSQPEV